MEKFNLYSKKRTKTSTRKKHEPSVELMQLQEINALYDEILEISDEMEELSKEFLVRKAQYFALKFWVYIQAIFFTFVYFMRETTWIKYVLWVWVPFSVLIFIAIVTTHNIYLIQKSREANKEDDSEAS